MNKYINPIAGNNAVYPAIRKYFGESLYAVNAMRLLTIIQIEK